MTKKVLLVSSALQAALLTDLLIHEFSEGFWKGMRPAGHEADWKDVSVEVSSTNQLGPVGFTPRKNYGILNPAFTEIHEAAMVSIAQRFRPSITFKTLKKEILELSAILGGRMTDRTKEPARAWRGNNRAEYDTIRSVNRQKVLTVAGAKTATKVARKTAVKEHEERVVSRVVNGVKSEVIITKTAAGATVRHVKV